MNKLSLITAAPLIASLGVGCGKQKIEFEQEAEPVPIEIGQGDVFVQDPRDPLLVQKTETFFQSSEDPRVDILFVNDNSLSMYNEQVEMGKKFGAFTTALANIDWQIAMTTTDVSDGKFGLKGQLLPFSGMKDQNILTKSTPEYEKVFESTVARKETLDCSNDPTADKCPSGAEMPLKATMMAIDLRDKDNSKFFRKRSSLAVVALSDEDENSDGVNATKPEEVLSSFYSAWPIAKNFAYYGIIVEPGDKDCYDIQNTESASYYGKAVSALAKMTGGMTGSICEKDYTQILSRIARSVRNLVDGVDLSQVPESGTVKIDFDPVQNITYSVVGRKIFFDQTPLKGSKMKITYVYRKAANQ